jgi:hypothetical protein
LRELLRRFAALGGATEEDSEDERCGEEKDPRDSKEELGEEAGEGLMGPRLVCEAFFIALFWCKFSPTFSPNRTKALQLSTFPGNLKC